MAEIDINPNATGMTVFEMLEQAERDIAAVYNFGLFDIKDEIDRNHIKKGYETLNEAMNVLRKDRR
jgi:hypothetical protein